jgi:hypothetical protein
VAGDWLKMDSSTPDKPEVLAITARMGWDDPDMTVGKLFRVWRWFDQQTTDGNAPGVTSALLDRIAGVTGFADAMRLVGWLVVTDDGLSLPKFDRHNGATAKARAQTAKRVASHRGNAEGNAVAVTGALAREEKRREEENTPQSPKGEPEGFTAFWSEWPSNDRKGSKAKCLDAWRKAKCERDAMVILAHIERLKTSDDWRREAGRFIPAPLVYLNQRRWDGAEAGAQQSGLNLAGAI